jgi:hypothetical protein
LSDKSDLFLAGSAVCIWVLNCLSDSLGASMFVFSNDQDTRLKFFVYTDWRLFVFWEKKFVFVFRFCHRKYVKWICNLCNAINCGKWSNMSKKTLFALWKCHQNYCTWKTKHYFLIMLPKEIEPWQQHVNKWCTWV